MKRREFLRTAAVAAASAVSVANTAPGEHRLVERLRALGVALFTIPKLLDEDLERALKLLADIGYKEVELFGPYPFSAPAAHERWAVLSKSLGLTRSGFFGLSAKEMKAALDRHALSAPAMHVDLGTLRTRLAEAVDAAHTLDMKYVGISSIPADERRTLDGYKRVADELNRLGASARKRGVRMLYHNHGYGLTELEGEIPLRVVLDRIDPDLVVMEMDLFWTIAGGADPVELFDSYRGRYKLVHIKDMKQRVRFSRDGGDAAQWMELFPHMTDAGSGVLDLPASSLTHGSQASSISSWSRTSWPTQGSRCGGAIGS